MSNALISLQSLTIARGRMVLAEGLTGNVHSGDIILLTGPNGAGKTSYLRALAGLLAPAAGAITRAGETHFLGAHPLTASLETPRQYLKFQAALMDGAFLADDVFGITPVFDTPLLHLSSGWRQRVKLSRLRLAHRAIWLLDEPTDGLDAAGIALLQTLVETHRQTGGAVIIATHQPQLWPGAQIMPFGAVAA